MEEFTSKIKYMLEKKPEKIEKLVKHWYKQDPEMVEGLLETMEEDGHIADRGKYDELIQRLKWANDKGRGERWKPDELEKWSKVDFRNVDYTKYDFAYLVNMLYSKCCKEYTDMSFYIKIAKCLLEDKDEETKMYRGAEHSKHMHKMRGPQSYYDEYDNYDEENRRGVRRYRNERINDYDDYRNDYRNYDRPKTEYDRYDSKYQDNNVGFR